MNHSDHVRLLAPGIAAPGGVWGDLGSGAGAFTLALAELLGPGGRIYSVDKDRRALKDQEHLLGARFPASLVTYIVADFTRPLALPALDGVVMANSLHFQQRKAPVLQQVRSYLRPGGRLILVEYNVDQGNIWVPYPLSYQTWQELAPEVGFGHTELLATVPSRFLREMYAALSY